MSLLAFGVYSWALWTLFTHGPLGIALGCLLLCGPTLLAKD